MIAIEIKSLTKRYGDLTAVNDVSFSVEKGELFSLLGINGSGKTTIIKMLSGLTKPTEGKILILGENIAKNPIIVKEKLNISPQETAVAPNLSVRENLELIAGIYDGNRFDLKKKVDSIIHDFNLGEIEKSRAKILSGGWQRRLSVAMAFISEPQILFLDEPTLGLDVIARRGLWSIIEKLKGKTTIILTTHYMEEAEALSDRIGVISSGKLKIIGTAKELIDKAGAKNFENAFIKLVEQTI
jgi:ABC-2 type transport system ATP-binding protein